MIYSDLYTQQKKISSIFVVFIFIFVFGVFLKLTSFNNNSTSVKASPNLIKRLEITNISPIQITIFWQTEEKLAGWLIYGDKKNNLTNIVLDDRDSLDNKSSYFNHLVTLKNLKPNTTYYFTIVINNKKIVNSNGELFTFKTPAFNLANTKLLPANGKLVEKNLSGLSGAIVLLTVNKNIYPLLTETKSLGEWLIPLNSFYEKNTLKEIVLTGQEKAIIEFFNENGQTTKVISSLKKLSSSSSTFIIGQNYQLDDSDVLGEKTNVNNFQYQKIDIIYPQQNALIPGRRPIIKGQALPNRKIYIDITSNKNNYSSFVYADKFGNWNYLLPENLNLGDYLLKIKTIDENNKEVVLTRNFKIIDNGGFEGRVLGEATGEPTITLVPTTIPTIIPTAVQFSPTETLPKSGISDFIPVIGGVFFILLGGAILLVF